MAAFCLRSCSRRACSSGGNVFGLLRSESVRFYRVLPSWIDAEKAGQRQLEKQPNWFSSINELFLDERVQKLLNNLNTRSFDAALFYKREGSVLRDLRRSKHHLMSNEELELMRQQMGQEAIARLQIPPIMDCRVENDKPISEDLELAGFDTADFIFTDISFGTTDRNRTIVKRGGADGTLRPVIGKERDRINRIYFAYDAEHNEGAPFVPVDVPKLTFEPYLERALANDMHAHIMNVLCQVLEPDSEDFIRVSVRTYQDADSNRKHENLWSTRYWAVLCFYVSLNLKFQRVMHFLAEKNLLSDCADLCRLSAVIHPKSSFARGNLASDDHSVIEQFMSRTKRLDGSLQLALDRMLSTQGKSDENRVLNEA